MKENSHQTSDTLYQDISAFNFDTEFQQLNPPSTDDEQKFLKESLLVEGQQSPILVWEEEGVVIDGHTRLKLLGQLHEEGLLSSPLVMYQTISFQNRDDALEYAARIQLGRRNVTDAQKRFLLGKIRFETKYPSGGDRLNQSTDTLPWSTKPKTKKELAEEHGVSTRAVADAEMYYQSVTLIAETLDISQDVLLTDNLSIESINLLGKFVQEDPEKAKEILNAALNTNHRSIATKLVRDQIDKYHQDNVTPTIPPFTEEELDIYEQYKAVGYAVAHVDNHRNLWDYAQKEGIGVYIGRRENPLVPGRNDPKSKWGNPYLPSSRFTDKPADGTRNQMVAGYYMHISNKRSLHDDVKNELRNKILFCHCYPSLCHGHVLAAIANGELDYMDMADFTKLIIPDIKNFSKTLLLNASDDADDVIDAELVDDNPELPALPSATNAQPDAVPEVEVKLPFNTGNTDSIVEANGDIADKFSYDYDETFYKISEIVEDDYMAQMIVDRFMAEGYGADLMSDDVTIMVDSVEHYVDVYINGNTREPDVYSSRFTRAVYNSMLTAAYDHAEEGLPF